MFFYNTLKTRWDYLKSKIQNTWKFCTVILKQEIWKYKWNTTLSSSTYWVVGMLQYLPELTSPQTDSPKHDRKAWKGGPARRSCEMGRQAGGGLYQVVVHWSLGIIGGEYSAHSRLPLLPSCFSDTLHKPVPCCEDNWEFTVDVASLVRLIQGTSDTYSLVLKCLTPAEMSGKIEPWPQE